MVGRFGRRRRQDAEDAHPAGPPGLDGPVVVGGTPDLAPAPQHRAAAWEAAGKAAGACLVVTGPAGVGKTQFAAALALDLWQDGLDLLIWVDGADPTEVVEVYAETARLLGLPGAPPGDPRAAAEVLPKWLSVTHRRWLLVLDGVGDPADVTPWLPRSHGAAGRVVITTRGEDTAPPADDRLPLRLGPFTEDEATAYLRERLTEAGTGELHEPAAAAELAHALDRSPVALALAAAHLIEERRGLREYLALRAAPAPAPWPGRTRRAVRRPPRPCWPCAPSSRRTGPVSPSRSCVSPPTSRPRATPRSCGRRRPSPNTCRPAWAAAARWCASSAPCRHPGGSPTRGTCSAPTAWSASTTCPGRARSGRRPR